MNRIGRALAASLLLLLAAAAATAHEGSTSYLELSDGRPEITGRLDVALIDVAASIPIDTDADRRLTWDEVWGNRDPIARELASAFEFSRDGTPCTVQVAEPWLTQRLGLPYLSFDISARCPKAGALAVASSLFFDSDESHRVLVALDSGSTTSYGTLSPIAREWAAPASDSAWSTALAFIGHGIWHVWIGYDHLLFLLLLLLPAVAARGADTAGRGRAIALDLVRIVTAFTLAHSITLGLAAAGLVRLPQQPVEAAIAASIVLAALLNFFPGWWRMRLPLAFGFGLVHGFGFANALAGLGAGAAPLPVLAGFNVGVELANLAAIAVALPVLLHLSRRGWYATRALPALSLAAAAVGAAWLVDRL